MKEILWICCFVIIAGCSGGKKNYPKLEMSDDEIVKALVEMYTAKAAVNVNDISFRDSTSKVYYQQIEKTLGRPLSVIQSDFEKLQKMPDSLIVLQNRALDTLRSLQEKGLTNGAGLKYGIN